MTEERVSPLRQRMIEDMTIRGLAEKTQKALIRNVKHFPAFLGRPPDTATPEELRAFQLEMTEVGVSASTFNVRIISLFFFFGIICGREDMKRFMQFHRKPRKLPIVLSVEEVADLLAASRPRAQVSRGPRHQLWRGSARLRGMPSQGHRHRQRSNADPCR